jgi:hypothetical protein
MPPYGKTSFDGVRSALKDLARYSTSSEGTFGAPDEVDPVTIWWARLPDGAGCRSERRSTSSWNPVCPSGSTD